MRKSLLVKVAASSLIMAVTMVGCTGAAYQSHVASVGAKAQANSAKLAADAEKSLAKRDFAKAQFAAEAAVEAKPDSGDYRALLGRAYLANGRFVAAETAFSDAMTLGNRDSRTIVSLSLIRTAGGRAQAARTLLTENMDSLPAADYGLAMAMAGDAPEAVRVLSQAIHESTADSRTRQNLAYAYALSGRWRDAGMIAAQDVPPAQLTARLAQWSVTAAPGSEPQRVVALLGVSPRADDTGLPTRLALAPAAPASEPVAVAQAEPAPQEPAAIDATPAPVQVAQVETPAPAEAPVVQTAEVSPYLKEQKASVLKLELPDPSAERKSLFRRAAWMAPVEPSSASTWVVQLGAYSSAATAQDGWKRFAKDTTIGNFPVINSNATVNGKYYHRVAIAGFTDREAANKLCQSVRAKGGACFVRLGGPEASGARWAAAWKKQHQQIAMR